MDYIPRLTFKSRAAVADERWMGGGEREREVRPARWIRQQSLRLLLVCAGGNQAGVVSIVCSSSTQMHLESILTTPEHTRQQKHYFTDGEIVAQSCWPRPMLRSKKREKVDVSLRMDLNASDDTIKKTDLLSRCRTDLW